METSQSCNCCAHKTVCKNVHDYELACNMIKTACNTYGKDAVDVTIKCRNFMQKHDTIRSVGGAENAAG